MSDRIDTLLEKILDEQRSIDTRLERIETILDERCNDRQRQIDGLQAQVDRIRRGNSGSRNSQGWVDPRFWTAIATALVALATAIAAILGAR